MTENSISVADEQTLITDLKSVDFRLMYLAFLANIMFGLVLISRFSNIVTDIFGRGKDEAASVVAINGGFNLAGRLIFSLFSDFVGRKNCYVFMLSTQARILSDLNAFGLTGQDCVCCLCKMKLF